VSRVELGFGLITCQRFPGESRPDAELIQDALDLAERADRLGLASVWVSEHHFVDDAYLPAPLPLCAAIAARTLRIAIGTGLLLAPLHEAVRLAEDAAVVDGVSRGRLILGLGLGWRAEEFDGLGIPLGQRGRRLEDTVATLRQAWEGGPVTGGAQIRYPQLLVRPLPARPGGPPIWIGAMAEVAVRRAGRIAQGFMATEVTPMGLAEQVGWALEARERAGADLSDFTVSMHAPVFAWEGPGARALVGPHHRYVAWKYDDMEGRRYGQEPDAASRPLRRPGPGAGSDADLIVGSPEAVAERIQEFADAISGQVARPLHFIARAYWPGMDPAVQRESLRLLGERVAPLLRAVS